MGRFSETELVRRVADQITFGTLTMKSTRISTVQSAVIALFSRAHVASVSEYFSPDYRVHLTDVTLKGHGPIVHFLTEVHRAFPKLTVEVDILLEADDRLAWQRTLRGIQKNVLQGFPATDKEVVWRDMVVTRFENGLIAEEWVVSDLVERVLRSRKKS